MDVSYPTTACSKSPTEAHHYLRLPNSSIYRCKYCWTAIWLPTEWSDTISFCNEIRAHGLQIAYSKRLAKMPKVLETLEFLLSTMSLKDKGTLTESDIMAVTHNILKPKVYDNEYNPCWKPRKSYIRR